MERFYQKITILLSTICFFYAASAHAHNFQPYIGAYAKLFEVNYKTKDGIAANNVFNSNFEGATISIGTKIYRYFGIELSYSRLGKETRNNVLGTGNNTAIKMSAYDFDLLGFFPIDSKGKFELIGNFGIEFLNVDMNANYSAIGFTSFMGTKGEDRAYIGLGLEWHFNDNFALRGLAKFKDANFCGIAKHSNNYQFGLVFFM